MPFLYSSVRKMHFKFRNSTVNISSYSLILQNHNVRTRIYYDIKLGSISEGQLSLCAYRQDFIFIRHSSLLS